MELDCDLNNINVRSFILTGAPALSTTFRAEKLAIFAVFARNGRRYLKDENALAEIRVACPIGSTHSGARCNEIYPPPAKMRNRWIFGRQASMRAELIAIAQSPPVATGRDRLFN